MKAPQICSFRPLQKWSLVRFCQVFLPKVVFGLIALGLSACAVGPFIGHDLGRTQGEKQVTAGLFFSDYGLYALKLDGGVSENFDLGLHIEPFSFGGRAKYSVLNNQDSGLSIAGAVGIGASFGGDYSTYALATSYKKDWLEPFFTLRHTLVDNDFEELRDSDNNDIYQFFPLFDYSYTQAMLGSKFWMSKSFALSFEAAFFIIEDDVEFESGPLLSGGFDFVF